jgi:hypothetical protein
MKPYMGMLMNHMIADTEEELHEMVDKIKVNRKHYQGDHYDICASKRMLALENGAVPITTRELARMAINRRRGLPLHTPRNCR